MVAPKAPPPKKPSPSGGPPAKLRAKKTFRVSEWGDEGEGQRIIVVGDSGMGKTTLVSMSPKPVFIGIDEGGRMIKNPLTGEHLKRIGTNENPIQNYEDILDVMDTPELFEGFDTVAIDTVTMVEAFSLPYVIKTIKTDKGASVKSILGYGYGKGFRHIYDTFTGFLGKCDNLIRAGKNVILIGQSAPSKVANAGGDDYIRDDVRLQSTKDSNVAQANEWADHVLRIRYNDLIVQDKKARGTTERAIFVSPEVHFFAKSRTLKLEDDAGCVSFESPEDDSIWRMLFPENYEE